MTPHLTADPHDLFRHPRPDFLVISPPKTGSTWLAANFRCHPDLFVPEVKEVKYFSSLFKWLDFGWYCDHFAPAGGRRAGEASPSYASLPLSTIRLVRGLLPDVKLVFLMRDPVSRAWSHAKHNHRYREANFAGTGSDFGAVTDDQWRANFGHDWPLVSGDYLGQLRRWASVFPAEQLFVGFYEAIAARPVELLRDLFRFLGVDPNVDVSGFPVGERILAGPAGELPPQLAAALRGALGPRTEELAGVLRERFGLEVPPEWRNTLAPPAPPPAEVPRAFREETDGYLAGVLGLEETFVTGYRPVLADYRGYEIVFSGGQLYGVARARGPVSAVLDGAARERLLAEGACVVAPTLSEMKALITTRLLEQAERRFQAVEGELGAAREVAARLTDVTTHLTDQAARLAAELAAVRAALDRPSLARRVARAVRSRTRRAGRRVREHFF